MEKDKTWQCTHCGQKFIKKNQRHSCKERSVESFLEGKSETIIELFYHITESFQSVGDIVLHPAKSQISFASTKRFAFIPRIGKTFIDLGLTFPSEQIDNECFYRIGRVPDTNKYIHYIRFENKEDINDEVLTFMKLAYKLSIQKN